MYEKAIGNLKLEIEKANNLIKNIENFDLLELSDKIEVLKNSSLRYERKEMPKIIQECFKSQTLRDGIASLDVNDFRIKCNNYIVNIALYNTRLIEVENSQKISNMELRTPIEINEDSIVHSQMLEDFLENPTYSKCKDVIKEIRLEPSFYYKINYFLNKKLVMNEIKREKCCIKSYLNYQENHNRDYYGDIEKNKVLEANNNEFLELIKEDLDYFKDKGYKIRFKFKKNYL